MINHLGKEWVGEGGREEGEKQKPQTGLKEGEELGQKKRIKSFNPPNSQHVLLFLP